MTIIGTTVAGVIVYQCLAFVYTGIAVAPNWALGALFGIGAFFGPLYGQFTRTGKALACPKRLELLDPLSRAERIVERSS